MLDYDLFAGENARPTLFAPAPWQFALFPQLVAPNFWDLRVIMDLARARPVYANFRVATAFNNQADAVWRFGIFVDNDPAFSGVLANPSLLVARSHDVFAAGMNQVGTMFQVAMPPMSDLTRMAADGRRYIALGIEALMPTADYTQGGIDAFLTPHPLPTRPYNAPSGY